MVSEHLLQGGEWWRGKAYDRHPGEDSAEDVYRAAGASENYFYGWIILWVGRRVGSSYREAQDEVTGNIHVAQNRKYLCCLDKRVYGIDTTHSSAI